MALTETEAQKRWCPFAREPQFVVMNPEPGHAIVGGCNRDDSGKIFERNNCIGSRCMAWRWDKPDLATNTSRGHCGLAGAP